MSCLVNYQPAVQRAFAYRACFFGHPLAGDVTGCDDDFQANEIGALEGPASQQFNGGRRRAAARGCRADPVSKIAAAVRHVDLIQAATSQKAALMRNDGELECQALPECLDLQVEP